MVSKHIDGPKKATFRARILNAIFLELGSPFLILRTNFKSCLRFLSSSLKSLSDLSSNKSAKCALSDDLKN